MNDRDKVMMKRCIMLTVGFMMLIGAVQEARATPTYAIRSANACDTCHIEPMGWAQPELKDRRCSMDCVSCHVSPTGGGMRTSSGLYYGRETLPTWGDRPSSHANPEKYLPKGYPTKGRYRIGSFTGDLVHLFDGFSGWWPGPTKHTDIKERYGDINADPAFRVGADTRFMNLFQLYDDEAEAKFFPMQADVYLMGKPLDKMTVYTNIGLRGRKNDVEEMDYKNYLVMREFFVKGGQFDYNSYVRAGRFNPAYGWRLPDHTSFTRRGLGFGENRQVYGVEAGLNPNYFYGNASVFHQGIDAIPGDEQPQGQGMTLNAGWRDLGYQIGGSVQYLNRNAEDNSTDDLTMGLQWGMSFYPLVYIAQYDVQIVMAEQGDNTVRLFAMQELDYLIYRGINAKIKYDWLDSDTNIKDDHQHRVALGLEWHVYTSSHIEAQYRRMYVEGNHPIIDFAKTSLEEFLVMLHAWF